MSIWAKINKRSEGEVMRKEETIGLRDIEFDRLNKMLKQGIVHFKYRKKSKVKTHPELGEEREAWGTKNPDIIGLLPRNPNDRFSTNNTARAGYINYWDCEEGGWRCFDPDRLLGAEYHIYKYEDLDFIQP